MRVERVALEHHCDAPPRRSEVVDPLAVEQEIARGDVLEARDQPKQRGLAAPRGADEDHELALFDLEVDALDDVHRAVGLAHVFQLQMRHDGPP
ncbi:MAG: hypothetical protein BWY50_01879 [Spirochaetes bacterium ADurb.Bin315]|nr:MAG: hypothetical protein BWY50_01879 [Spirochaetes bacterium ADurb.Bin315]